LVEKKAKLKIRASIKNMPNKMGKSPTQVKRMLHKEYKEKVKKEIINKVMKFEINHENINRGSYHQLQGDINYSYPFNLSL
jgi:hypothetical protein